MKTIQNLSFAEFWPLWQSPTFTPSDTTPFSQEQVYHIYADLDLNLDLAAAQGPAKAMRYLNLIEEFSTISDRCCHLVPGMRIAEVQGGRIHFVFPAPPPLQQLQGPQGLASVVNFSAALIQMAFAELKPRAGQDWKAFSMAADYGPTVFVPSTFGGGTLVSLGNAANQPAKRLGRGVQTGHLAIPSSWAKLIPGAMQSGTWHLIDLTAETLLQYPFLDPKVLAGVRQIAQQFFESWRPADRTFSSQFSEAQLQRQPLRVRGFCLRADLDGFTNAVDSAFAAGPKGVEALVRNFLEGMEYPNEFKRREAPRQIVELPWAGDCCTLFILPSAHETIDEMREILPVSAGKSWHGIADDKTSQKHWASILGVAKWAIGFACGDKDTGGDGWVVISEIQTSSRKFRIISGWSPKRAKDAQECPGVGADDIVVPEVDRQNLEYPLRALFSPVSGHPSYSKSTYGKLKTASSVVSRYLSESKPRTTTGSAPPLPRPRPHGGSNPQRFWGI